MSTAPKRKAKDVHLERFAPLTKLMLLESAGSVVVTSALLGGVGVGGVGVGGAGVGGVGVGGVGVGGTGVGAGVAGTQ